MSMIGELPVTKAAARPTRTCIGCRASCAQDRLLRFCLDGTRVAPALARRARRGRSAYLCPRRACLDRALERRAFSRAFSSLRTPRSVNTLDAAAADALWAATLEQLRCEIERFDRSSENTHAQVRRRGLEQLLFELSSQPAPPDRRPCSNGQGGSPTHG